MATLSFNPTRLRRPTVKSQNPSLNSTYSKKSINKLFTASKTLSNARKNHIKWHSIRCNSLSESSVSSPTNTEINEEEDDPTAELSYLDPETDPESISEWELDFCSRPILDIRGKKVWELVVCDSSLSLQYTKYFPNNVINSITLIKAIASISEELGVRLPERIRFFR